MHDNHDLSFVPPERHATVRHRIAVVQRFLRAPGRKAAESAAAEIGLKVAQFYNLARAWRELGRPEALAGSGNPRRVRQYSVDPKVAAVMDDVIAANPRLDPAKLIGAVTERIAKEDMRVPGPQVVTAYVFRARPGLLPAEHRVGSDVVIDHAVLDLPVALGDGPPARPLATFVVDTRAETVIGLALSEGAPSPGATAAALLDALRSGLRDAPAAASAAIDIAIPIGPEGDWARLDSILQRAGATVDHPIVTPHKSGRVVTALLGLAPNGIALRPRLVQIYLEKRSRNLPATPAPLDAAAATEFVRARLVTRRANTTFARLDCQKRQRLMVELGAMADGTAD